MDTCNTKYNLVEHCPLPMFTAVGDAHTLTRANTAFCQLCNKTREMVVGHALEEVLLGYDGVGNLLAVLDRVIRTGVSEVFFDPAPTVHENERTSRSYVAWTVPAEPGQPAATTAIIFDGPEIALKNHNRELGSAEILEANQALILAGLKQHELAEAAEEVVTSLVESEDRKLTTAVFEERNRIAREIHDTLAQAFTGILLQLRVAQRIAERSTAEAWHIIEHVCDLAKEGLAEARRSVWSLQSEALEYGDLISALTSSKNRVSTETGVRTELYIHGEPRTLTPEVGMNLLRIAQESMNNAIRHGEAKFVWIGLTFQTKRVVLRIQDDGKGFNLMHQTNGPGFGMIGMGQRADRLGGELTIVSQPGQGTEVTVSVPLVDMRDEECQ